MLLEKKAIFCLIFNLMIIIWGLILYTMLFNLSNSWYNRDNYEMVIRILHFLNRCIDIIMDCGYNENPIDLQYHLVSVKHWEA